MIKGIDISANNLIRDYSGLHKSGLGFAYIKATEGNYYQSKTFQGESNGIRKSPMLEGYYHFYRAGINPKRQADLFLKTITSVANDPIGLPPMLDIEDMQVSFSAADYINRIGDWLQIVEKSTGLRPIIYTGGWYWKQFLNNCQDFKDYLLWDASYTPKEPATFGGWDKITIWQYSDKGNIAGISPVDVDVFNGSFSELWALSGKSKLSPSKIYSTKAEALQQALTANGFDTKGEDGYFGQNTLFALHKYQDKMEMGHTDGVNATLWSKLFGITDFVI